MHPRTPAQLYALVAGTLLTVGGIVGLFYSSSFGSPGHVDAMFGLFDVNGWENLLHLATGLLGLLALGYGARTYALAIGVIYVVTGIWGLLVGSGDSILGFLPVDVQDDLLHLALGGLGLLAGTRP